MQNGRKCLGSIFPGTISRKHIYIRDGFVGHVLDEATLDVVETLGSAVYKAAGTAREGLKAGRNPEPRLIRLNCAQSR